MPHAECTAVGGRYSGQKRSGRPYHDKSSERNYTLSLVLIPLDYSRSRLPGGQVWMRLARILLAAAVLSSCGVEGDCTLDSQRCQDNAPQYCVQSPYASEGVGVWVSGTSCEQAGEVCRVDENGTASCVTP